MDVRERLELSGEDAEVQYVPSMIQSKKIGEVEAG